MREVTISNWAFFLLESIYLQLKIIYMLKWYIMRWPAFGPYIDKGQVGAITTKEIG